MEIIAFAGQLRFAYRGGASPDTSTETTELVIDIQHTPTSCALYEVRDQDGNLVQEGLAQAVSKLVADRLKLLAEPSNQAAGAISAELARSQAKIQSQSAEIDALKKRLGEALTTPAPTPPPAQAEDKPRRGKKRDIPTIS